MKILSDVDDTLYSSLFDESFPRGTIYPGVLSFQRALDDHNFDSGEIAFLTARPEGVKGIVRQMTKNHLASLGVDMKLAAVLSGSFKNFIGNENIAKKKFENFVIFQSIYPEYDFIFLGDR